MRGFPEPLMQWRCRDDELHAAFVVESVGLEDLSGFADGDENRSVADVLADNRLRNAFNR